MSEYLANLARNWNPAFAKVAFSAGVAHKLSGYYLQSAAADYDLPAFARDRSRFRLYAIPFNTPRPKNLEPYWAYLLLYDVPVANVKEPHVIEDLARAVEITFEELEALAKRFPWVEVKPAPRRPGE